MGHKVKQIGDRTWHIDESSASMYLVAGDTSAVLIDTAYGTTDVREVIRNLTDLPYQVVITHAHPDHIGGIGVFDEVFIHGADIGIAALMSDSTVLKTIEELGVDKPAGRHPVTPTPVFHRISQGDVFDLGGRILTVEELPGHTFGSIGLLDREHDMLFSGDACNPNQLMGVSENWYDILTPGSGFTSVETFMKSLQKIMDLPVSRIYTGHLNELGFEPADKSMTKKLIHCCRIALGEEQDAAAVHAPGEDAYSSCIEYKDVRFTYNPGRVHEDWVTTNLK